MKTSESKETKTMVTISHQATVSWKVFERTVIIMSAVVSLLLGLMKIDMSQMHNDMNDASGKIDVLTAQVSGANQRLDSLIQIERDKH